MSSGVEPLPVHGRPSTFAKYFLSKTPNSGRPLQANARQCVIFFVKNSKQKLNYDHSTNLYEKQIVFFSDDQSFDEKNYYQHRFLIANCNVIACVRTDQRTKAQRLI